jgi:hypothetical protein
MNNSAPTMEHRRAQLKGGARSAECNVTVNNRNGVLTLAIKDVNPRLPEGNYTLTVDGKPPTQWKRDRDGWTRLT